MRYASLILLAAVALLIAGCGENAGNNPKIVTLDATDSNLHAVVSANNRFAFDLYKELIATGEGNIFFSPYSISTALAMTYEGARGETAQQMKEVFHFPEKDILRKGSNRMYHIINRGADDYTLRTGNALWAQQDFAFLDSYLNTVGEVYGGKTSNVDFVHDTADAVKTINTWVEDQTEGKIKDILSEGDVSPMTRLVLTNAIYFKGDWKLQFKQEDTDKEQFYLTPDNPVDVSMMHLSGEDAQFLYMENDDLQAVVLPYEGDEVSMMVLVPKGDDYNEMDALLTTEYLDSIEKGLVSKNVILSMPKFKFETRTYLASKLKKMGMPLAFSRAADFSGMTGNKDIYIDRVIHQAYIDVDEEGTEAAAATTVTMRTTAMAPQEQVIFRADRPFVFLIRENTSGDVLFMGKVRDPRD
ncbi:MAG: serpin family protein [DPANN group archaeon]|nr:serpin family protein [DPANN group archaeon]